MQTNGRIKLVATDLDGTFLRDDKTISDKNIVLLDKLGGQGIVRVVATGRNLQKTFEVIPEYIPFDYIVFSSGAGIYNWQTGELLYACNIPKETVSGLSEFFIRNDRAFHLFKAVPENNFCWYFRNKKPSEEFERYFEFHNSFSKAYPENEHICSNACQFLVILPNIPEKFEQLKKEIQIRFPGLKIVRVSSPLGTPYIWMEIFHEDVSKGNGVKLVCEKESIDYNETFGIGNDYNDVDLLDFTKHSFIVENGPFELKQQYPVTVSNEKDAFSVSVSKYL